jgi:signal transduction histidine kinase
VLTAITWQAALAPGIEQHLAQFADLVATALANAQARTDLQQLADEQAALRRVAELVARGVDQDELFATVAVEASRLVEDEAATLMRSDDDGGWTIVASSGGPAPVGTRTFVTPDDEGVVAEILRTRRPARLDDYSGITGRAWARDDFGVASCVAVPIFFEDRIWGVLGITRPDRGLPVGAEQRLQQFAELVAAAIANAENRARLNASRARVMSTADDTRRRVQRDVHDGAQQRLVQTIINLKLATAALGAGDATAAGEFLAESLQHAEQANADLRDLVRGILPAALSRGGLRAGVESLVGDLRLPVAVEVSTPRLPPDIETTAYFVIAEALTNVVKHAGASRARVVAVIEGDHLAITVADDGAGGADATRGSGLTGLYDRVEAGDGTLCITSPPGQGTTVQAALPVLGAPVPQA